MRLITPQGDEYRLMDAATVGPPTITGNLYSLNATIERDGEYWPGINTVYGCTLEIADFRQREVEMHIRGFRLIGGDDPKLVYSVVLQWRTDTVKPQQIYIVDGKRYTSQDAMAALERLYNCRYIAAEWVDATTHQDAADGLQIWLCGSVMGRNELFGKLEVLTGPLLTPDDTPAAAGPA
jgi:hypothetical protein